MRNANIDMVARVLTCINLAEWLGLIIGTGDIAKAAASPESYITHDELSELIDGAVDGLATVIVGFGFLEDHIRDHGAMFAPWGHDSTGKILATTDRAPILHDRPKTAQAWVHEIAFELWVRIYKFTRPTDPKSATDYLSSANNDRLLICNPASSNPKAAILSAKWVVRFPEHLPDDCKGSFLGLEWSDDLARAIAPIGDAYHLDALPDLIRHELREWMTRYVPAAEHQATIDAAEALAGLEAIQHDMRFTPRTTKPRSRPAANESAMPRKDATVNERMAAKFQGDPSLATWTSTQWSERLGVTGAAVRQTKTWETIKKMRAFNRYERLARQP